MSNVLIIDDEKTLCDGLSAMVKRLGYDAAYALTLKDGINKASTGTFDVVFLDVRMPDGSGLDALPEILTAPSAPEVIIMTGVGDPDGAELAIKAGAWDYIEKPFSTEKIKLLLIRTLEYRNAKKNVMVPEALNLADIIGSGPQMRSCFDILAKAANSEANVLITGETGTGKELFAKAVHYNSPRANKSFVVVDCAALPETLVESTLFGHEKGAFTGADKFQEGLIKQADGGTLFLDEIGELSLSIQKSFLRVLQERRFRPVGGKNEVQSDFRLVAATNRDLNIMAGEGRFRKDMLYRLRSLTLELPPLKQRHEDIKEMVLHYTTKICEDLGLATKGFSPDFFYALYAYEWPGNVRELVNALEGVVSEARYEPTLFAKHLPEHIRVQVARSSVSKRASDNALLEKSFKSSGSFPALRALMETTERQYLQDLLSLTRGNIKETCRISGLSRSRLYDRLKKYNITRPS